jgi:hypothetical protein
LLAPAPEIRAGLQEARELVVVDDEITTGTTAANLTRALLRELPALEEVRWAALLSWREAPARLEAELERPFALHALASGRSRFASRGAPALAPLAEYPGGQRARVDDLAPSPRLGEAGAARPFAASALERVRRLSEGRPLDLIGVGEDMVAPFRLARALEALGEDVVFRATTRSPIAWGPGLEGGVAVPSPLGDGVPHYLYALTATEDRHRILVYPSRAALSQDTLPQAIGADAVALADLEVEA